MAFNGGLYPWTACQIGLRRNPSHRKILRHRNKSMPPVNTRAIRHFLVFFSHADLTIYETFEAALTLPMLENSIIVRVSFAAKRRAVLPAASGKRRNL